MGGHPNPKRPREVCEPCAQGHHTWDTHDAVLGCTAPAIKTDPDGFRCKCPVLRTALRRKIKRLDA